MYDDNSIEALSRSVLHYLKYSRVKKWGDHTSEDIYFALASTLRDRLVAGMLDTEQRYRTGNVKRLYYLSMEFLIGRLLGNNLINMRLDDVCRTAIQNLGENIEMLEGMERDPGLGNGGLGRLAACYLDSLATLDLPGFGYGINYQYGLFKQVIQNGFQLEKPDNWLRQGSPWLLERPGESILVPMYGRVVEETDREGHKSPMWLDWHLVVGMPYDVPVVGFGGKTVNYLRLYTALASDEFDMQIFNKGDYLHAVRQKIDTETISKILYPTDSFEKGQELRLAQEYFLVACSVRDIVNKFLKGNSSLVDLPAKVAIHLNDTHPALTVAELMRLLVDERDLPWERAWEITEKTCAVTNHTLLPEALETWSVHLMGKLLPRHLQIIYEINHRFLEQVELRWPGDEKRRRDMSLIGEEQGGKVRMINMAVVGSHSVNGVAQLHSRLIKENLLPNFYALWPERFKNVTNGITPRRWLLKANPLLANLISEAIGDGWITELAELAQLKSFADDSLWLGDLHRIKRKNKEALGRYIKKNIGESIDPDFLFDVQAKRFHEYKRQLLNVFRIIYDYLQLVEDGTAPKVPRVYIFAGKAAPGYQAAKLHIKLINNLATIINKDPRADGYMKVVFIPDYRVTVAEKIIPATDLSEQISTAGMEASGTGNMKFALNGSLTIGTYDGANIEIAEEVGGENIYIFGMSTVEVGQLLGEGNYNPWDYYYKYEPIRRVLDALAGDRFCPSESGLFHPVFRSIVDEGDRYCLLPDFLAYIEAQAQVASDYLQTEFWTRKTLANIAGMGMFSSDRAVMEYAEGIWGLPVGKL
ncbi:MAG: glycogen/starch/alpha-glucan phosphorylase [Desulfobulbaceae bacterium]|nr:glycogen/starch/alpha-glucan phosphorylase [Desulfobulbaceae bacterium]